MLLRRLYLLLGYAMVLLAAAGAVLPLLPTTPFLIAAVWALAKSLPVLAEKLRNPSLSAQTRMNNLLNFDS